jgi:hypothetical protein
MITGALKSQVDQVWNAFWSGGISNPLTVIEQITYLLFTKRLDEILYTGAHGSRPYPEVRTPGRALCRTLLDDSLDSVWYISHA